jgi:HK97 family phage prohead protease
MPKVLEGWLIKYGQPTQPISLANGKSVTEVIAPGAFKASIDAINAGTATIEANIEHVDDAISRIGLSGKNVKVEDRPEGVYTIITLTDDTLSNDVFAKAQAGIVTGLSVEFQAPGAIEPAYSIDANGNYVRTYNTLTLTGFAICTDPAYPDAQIVAAKETTSARSIAKTEVAKIAAEVVAFDAARELARKTEYHRNLAWLMQRES